MSDATEKKEKNKGRGFAAMDPARVRAFASKGGRASQDAGKAHKWNHETAVIAGRKGAAKRLENLKAKGKHANA